MRTETAPTVAIDIFVAGDIADARRICRAYCLEVGLCVTLESTEFIYTGGLETGVRVGLTNYPRFPTHAADLWHKALGLAESLRLELHQHSVMVRSAETTLWMTSREES
jgi:hypothetical protein